MRQTLVVTVENRAGELNRIAGLCSARGYNIESLVAVEEVGDTGISRITIVLSCDAAAAAKLAKQIDKQVRVLDVTNVSEGANLRREMALIRLGALGSPAIFNLMNLVSREGLKIISANSDEVIVEAVSEQNTLQKVFDLLAPFGVKEIVRTGTVAIAEVNHPLNKHENGFNKIGLAN